MDVSNLGCVIQRVVVPDRNGDLRDVVLGYDTIQEYTDNSVYFGCIAGRYANRIAAGRFALSDQTYQLTLNEGNNHLHGGKEGFSSRIFDVDARGKKVRFSYLSPDGEQGYPGNLNVDVEYSFSEDCALTIQYTAKTDKATVLNLTNHSYFNLDGHNSGDILSQSVKIYGKNVIPVKQDLIPEDKFREVVNTPFDFTDFKEIGDRIHKQDEQLSICGGYDSNYILNKSGYGLVAEAFSKISGIHLSVYTTKPGLQFYTGNFISNRKGKGNAVYQKHAGFCMETQFFPDSPNHADYPSAVLMEGETYAHKTVYQFGVM